MQEQRLVKEKAIELLKNGTVARVIGWKIGEFSYDLTPAIFESVEEVENEFVYNDINVFDKNHPKHNDFIKTLQNPIFKSDSCTINETMLNMKPDSMFSIFFTKIRSIFSHKS